MLHLRNSLEHFILIGLALLGLSFAPVNAAMVSINPVTDRTLDDLDNNGIFETIRSDAFISIGAVDYLLPTPRESRFAMEFDISSLLSGPGIVSAELQLTESSDPDFVSTTVPLYAYTGDGVINTPDASNLEVLISSDLSDGVQGTISLDVTSFIAGLYDNNESFAGFLGLMTVGSTFDNGQYSIFSSNASSGQPLLVVNTVNPVPVPAAVWLFGTALVGFIGLSRRRKVG